MEKIENSKILNTKKEKLQATKINKNNQSKNIIIEKSKKNIVKRKNNIHKTNKSLALTNLDKEKNLTKQNSNNFTISYNTDRKSNLYKSFLSNSCQKREKHLKYTKTNNLFNKTINIKHKKFFSISPDINSNYKRYLNQTKTNIHKQYDSTINETKKNQFKKLNKDKHVIKVNRIIFRNKNSLINNNKLLNRSVELRNKIKKFKLNENSKIN